MIKAARIALCVLAMGTFAALTACQPSGPKPVQVAVTVTHGCAVMSDHTVRCWGNNRGGNLGNGAASHVNTDSSIAVKVVGIANAKQVAVASHFSCAVLTNGRAKCWGEGRFGRLGNGHTDDHSTPVDVVGITNATSIDLNDSALASACASLATGQVKCWGSNAEAALGTSAIPVQGDRDESFTAVPVPVDGITNAKAVSAGYSSVCAVLTNGRVKCWGRNGGGQLGDPTLPTGDKAYIAKPALVVGLNGATTVSVGSGVACSMAAGTAMCWGHGSATPVAVDNGLGFTNVVATYAGCGVAKGIEYCWGPNDMHEVGNADIPTGSQMSAYRAEKPVPVSGLPARVVGMGASYYDSCAVLANASIYCWGYDLWGALGTGTNTQGDGTGRTNPGRLPQKVLGL